MRGPHRRGRWAWRLGCQGTCCCSRRPDEKATTQRPRPFTLGEWIGELRTNCNLALVASRHITLKVLKVEGHITLVKSETHFYEGANKMPRHPHSAPRIHVRSHPSLRKKELVQPPHMHMVARVLENLRGHNTVKRTSQLPQNKWVSECHSIRFACRHCCRDVSVRTVE